MTAGDFPSRAKLLIKLTFTWVFFKVIAALSLRFGVDGIATPTNDD